MAIAFKIGRLLLFFAFLVHWAGGFTLKDNFSDASQSESSIRLRRKRLMNHLKDDCCKCCIMLHPRFIKIHHLAMDQYLLMPFLGE
jgi:hypothetical protein